MAAKGRKKSAPKVIDDLLAESGTPLPKITGFGPSDHDPDGKTFEMFIHGQDFLTGAKASLVFEKKCTNAPKGYSGKNGVDWGKTQRREEYLIVLPVTITTKAEPSKWKVKVTNGDGYDAVSVCCFYVNPCADWQECTEPQD